MYDPFCRGVAASSRRGRGFRRARRGRDGRGAAGRARLQAGAISRWSGFTNFAISFTIISVLAGTFTTFGTAWANGGPVVISIGWPVICLLVLTVALSMSELTSAMPTAGGPYWWAAKLGGAGWSWYDGLVQHRRPGRDRRLGRLRRRHVFKSRSASTASTSSGSTSPTPIACSREQWLLFFLILILYTLVNIFGDRFLALFNNISVGWHVLGVAIIIGLLVFVPDDHQDSIRLRRAHRPLRLRRRLHGRRRASGCWCCRSASC